MKNRKVLGRDGDICDTTAIVAPDPYATERIIDACDWEIMNERRTQKIAAALDLLKEKDRAFAELVLSGKTWRDIGMPKRTFNGRLKRICDFIASR